LPLSPELKNNFSINQFQPIAEKEDLILVVIK
jgi:hypothetical protein